MQCFIKIIWLLLHFLHYPSQNTDPTSIAINLSLSNVTYLSKLQTKILFPINKITTNTHVWLKKSNKMKIKNYINNSMKRHRLRRKPVQFSATTAIRYKPRIGVCCECAMSANHTFQLATTAIWQRSTNDTDSISTLYTTTRYAKGAGKAEDMHR